MADPKKFKSIGIDTDTYYKLKRICEDERRNVRQQISIWVDKIIQIDLKKKIMLLV